MRYSAHEIPDDILLTRHFGGRYFNSEQAATFFGVSARTIRRWVQAGKMPPWARELLLIETRGLPMSGAWKGFCVRGGVLYTPYDKFDFTPRKLLATWYLINHGKETDAGYQLYLRAATGKLYEKSPRWRALASD